MGGRNLLRDSGMWPPTERYLNEEFSWQSVGADIVEIATEDGYSCIHAYGVNQEGMLNDESALLGTTFRIGSSEYHNAEIEQSTVYRLDFGTQYTYHAMIKLRVDTIAEAYTPLSCLVKLSDNPAVITDDQQDGAVLVELVSNKELLADQWCHIVIRFDTVRREDVSASYVLFKPMFSGSAVSEPNSNLFVRWVKLEKGTIPTDYTHASETTGDLMERLRTAEEKITDDAIVHTVMEHNEFAEYIDGVEKSIQEVSSSVTQTKQEVEIGFNQTNEKISNMQSTVDSMSTWYRFTAESLEIGKSNSTFKTRQDNQRYEFLNNNTVMGYMEGNVANFPRLNARSEIRFGDLCGIVNQNTGGIAWVWMGEEDADE